MLKIITRKCFQDGYSELSTFDREFIELFDNFAFDEVIRNDDIDNKTRFLAILAVLIGNGAVEEYKAIFSASFNFSVTPVEAKEVVYQAVAYLGIGRVFPFLKVTNEVLKGLNISLPLPPQATVLREERTLKGEQAQIYIFGESMRGFSKSGKDDRKHINKWLSSNCFGDYYTRGALNYNQREMITFCFLYAQGGCEPQLTAHIMANMCIGNDKDFLIKVVSQCLPYIGYPRSLNALTCIDNAYASFKK